VSTRLVVRGLTKAFGGLVAVHDVTLTAQTGQITAIIGPNGAGKTTLFNCISGFYRPTAGHIAIEAGGETTRIDGLTSHRLSRLGLARTFQNIRLFPGMTVLENLLVAQHRDLMPASLYSLAGILNAPRYRRAEHAAIGRAAALLERFGLLDRIDDAAGSLAYGEQRKLEIARALATEPRFLLLDEPAAGLNPRETAELSARLVELHRDFNIGIVLIEHDMHLVMQISDAVHVLDHGELIASDHPDAIQTNPHVIAAYLGEPEPADA
jgi:branched-chain amino acid transport system ATP-binding protein